ncbi:flagellar biosynthetic protein FliO [Aciditerrimonas ferrireducens]|uniref:flagellar biosynthetic protein FliO n=1 Tax=Aciditerrimonas ferrireducens TaxID=667306 RepID=UPI002003D3E8|nr:flagellar biosynthetic protein FliO [Aciditerrimonas ferrireducens]MCK4177626.1 flagellar biosynthetic protein FliO [Aciditerrimonas ferrireducens]
MNRAAAHPALAHRASAHRAAASPVASVGHRAATGSAHLAGSLGAQSISATSLLLQLAVGLAVVVGLVYLTARLLRGRLGARLTGAGSRGARSARGQAVAVLGRQSLGKGVSVALVQVAERAYLLGVTPGRVQKVAALDPSALGTGGPEEPSAGPRRWLAAGRPGTASGSPALPAWVQKVPGLSGLEARLRAATGHEGSGEAARPAGTGPSAQAERRRNDGSRGGGSGTGQGRARTRSQAGRRPAGDETWTSAIAELKERLERV